MILALDTRTALIVITLGIGLFLVYFVLRYSQDRLTKILFTSSVVSLLLWMFTTYVPLHPWFHGSVTVLSRLALLTAIGIAYFTWLLLFYVIYKRLPNKTAFRVITGISLAYVPLTLSPYFFLESRVTGGSVTTTVGPLMPLFALYAFGILLAASHTLSRGYHESEGDRRKQTLLLIYGTIGMYVGIIFTILVPVIVTGNAGNIQLGALYILFFLVMVASAIARYELFNIRLFSIQILVLLLNFFLLFQVVATSTSTAFWLSAVIFALALFVSYLFVQTANRAMKMEAESARVLALAEANRKLQALDKQKSEFITLAAHQLRTPLSVVSGFIELLKDGAYGKLNPNAVSVLDHVDENNARLVRLVDMFLAINQLDQGLVEFNFKEKNVVSLVREVVVNNEIRVQDKHLKLICEASALKIMALIDESKLRAVVESLVDNAIKYSEQGAIRVRIKEENNGVECTVTDEGLGFGMTDQEGLFEKFFRGENVRNIEVNGTGLGLHIAKKYIDGHHGKIWGESGGPGLGSTFGFWIPRQPSG